MTLLLNQKEEKGMNQHQCHYLPDIQCFHTGKKWKWTKDQTLQDWAGFCFWVVGACEKTQLSLLKTCLLFSVQQLLCQTTDWCRAKKLKYQTLKIKGSQKWANHLDLFHFNCFGMKLNWNVMGLNGQPMLKTTYNKVAFEKSSQHPLLKVLYKFVCK